jgi:hypothetical protein
LTCAYGGHIVSGGGDVMPKKAKAGAKAEAKAPADRPWDTWTKIRPFRLGDDTLAEMDAIMAKLAVGSRADVVRQAVRRWWMAEGCPGKLGEVNKPSGGG